MAAACTQPQEERQPQAQEEASPAQEPEFLIAYNVLENQEADNYEVYIADANGLNALNLSNQPGVDWVYSSHEGRLLMVSDRDTNHRRYFLYSVSSDGKDWKKLLNQELPDSWVSMHPNGKTLALCLKEDGSQNLALYHLEKDSLNWLIQNETKLADPVFNMDGSRIAYRLLTNNTEELWVYELESGQTERVYQREKTSQKVSGYLIGPPKWLSENEIAFIGLDQGIHRILSLNLSTKQVSRFTGDDGVEGWFDVHPNGNLLIFDSDRDQKGNYNIYQRNLETGEVRPLVQTEKIEMGPIFLKK